MPPCITNASLSLFNLNIIIPLSCLVAKHSFLSKVSRSKTNHASFGKFAQQCAWKCPICKWSCPHNLIQLCLGVHEKSHMTCSHDPHKVYLPPMPLCMIHQKKVSIKKTTHDSLLQINMFSSSQLIKHNQSHWINFR